MDTDASNGVTFKEFCAGLALKGLHPTRVALQDLYEELKTTSTSHPDQQKYRSSYVKEEKDN